MSLLTAAMANDQLIALHLVGHVLSRKQILLVLPVFITVKVCKHTQGEVLGCYRVSNVSVHAIRAVWAKSKHVVDAYFERIIMPEHAGTRAQVVTKLAEPLVVVRTALLLLRLETLFRLRVAVDAIVLLMADPILLDELADRHLVYIELVQEVTFVAAFAGISKPVDAHFLLALLVTDFVLVGEHVSLDLVIAHLLVDVGNEAARLRHIGVLGELGSGRLRLRKLRHA